MPSCHFQPVVWKNDWPVAWVMRIFEHVAGKPPDPYVGSATLVIDTDMIPTIYGLTMRVPFTLNMARAIKTALIGGNFTEVQYVRLQLGKLFRQIKKHTDGTMGEISLL